MRWKLRNVDTTIIEKRVKHGLKSLEKYKEFYWM